MDKNTMAFPQAMNAGSMAIAEGGLTMRDWFAGMAIAGRRDGLSDNPVSQALAARLAYAYADAMMAAREAKS